MGNNTSDKHKNDFPLLDSWLRTGWLRRMRHSFTYKWVPPAAQERNLCYINSAQRQRASLFKSLYDCLRVVWHSEKNKKAAKPKPNPQSSKRLNTFEVVECKMKENRS